MVSIAEASWFIKSKGLVVTADRFSDSVYDFIEKLSKKNISYKLCREPERTLLGFKCVQFKKYTIVLRNQMKRFLLLSLFPQR